jgi:putative FmdB family regulatory protein
MEGAMPIFEYHCPACGDECELLVLHSSPVPGCPFCGSEDLKKMMSISSVSSESVRKRATQDIRARNRALRRDHSHEEVKRLEAHAQDHDD